MTEEFYKRMKEATQEAIARKQSIIDANKEIAELYRRIVLGFVSTYDFISNTFKRELISNDLKKIIGRPDDIETFKKTYEEGREDLGAIKLKYEHGDIPIYMIQDRYDIDMINEMLKKDDIIVEDKTKDNCRHINIYYDAKVIVEACAAFDKELYGPQKVKTKNPE